MEQKLLNIKHKLVATWYFLIRNNFYIKFKAKRLDNGEWVYGSLIRSTAGVKERAYIVAGRTDLLKKYIDAQRIVLKQYTHVLFINGYRKDSPRIEKKIESITIGKAKESLCPDKWLETEFFIIKFK